MFVLRSIICLQRWSLSESALNGKALLVFSICLDHILVGVQTWMFTEDDRFMLENPEGAHQRKLLLCCFLIIKHVMGSILAEKDLACACCANFIASVLPYIIELQVLEVLKQCLLPDTGSPPVKWESKVWTLQEGGDLGVKCQDQISVLARLQGAVQRMSQPALPRWALHLLSPVPSLPASCRTWMIIWY